MYDEASCKEQLFNKFSEEVIKARITTNPNLMIHITKENNWYISESNLENLIYDWLNRNILKYEYDIDGVIERNNWQKYDRQIKNFGCLPQISNLDGINFQEKLKISKVAIIGVGGVGSYIAHSLASIGIGEIRIVDGDVVEISNTSRQILYLASDVGYKKVDIAKTRLHNVNPLMNIKILPRFLDEHSKGEIVDFLRGVDFLDLFSSVERHRGDCKVQDVFDLGGYDERGQKSCSNICFIYFFIYIF